jgi:hypothetical protein
VQRALCGFGGSAVSTIDTLRSCDAISKAPRAAAIAVAISFPGTGQTERGDAAIRSAYLGPTDLFDRSSHSCLFVTDTMRCRVMVGVHRIAGRCGPLVAHPQYPAMPVIGLVRRSSAGD